MSEAAADLGVLVTGATGFIGVALVERLQRLDFPRVRGAVRGAPVRLPGGVPAIPVGDLGPDTDWSRALGDIDVIVHTAARVHRTDDAGLAAISEYRRVNVEATLRLARQAAAAGTRRLIFLSSIKVNGEETRLGEPYTADDRPAPVDAYAVSKHEAEDGLRRLAHDTGIEIVVIRPALVYGPGVKGNFRTMMRWIARRFPLPLGGIHNRRSLTALDNLLDLIVECMRHPGAAQQTFLAADGEDLSTTELLTRVGEAFGGPARLFAVPSDALRVAVSLAGRRDLFRRLCGSLQADIAKNRRLLGWTPPFSVEETLRATAQQFLSDRARGACWTRSLCARRLASCTP